MITKKIINTLVLLILGSTFVFSQVEYTKHHVSVNASKFVLIFNEQVNNLDLTYRLTLADTTHSLRLATSIDLSTAEDAVTDYSIRMGVDRTFKISGNWKFYTGIDANYTRTNAKSAQRITTRIGAIPFIGFLYNFGPHFSISTEPSLAIFRNKTVDKDSFNPNANTSDFSFDLINIGQIKVGFHF
ncbi:MAG: hypothetical protein ACJA1A_001276 [Saprospiraceae bacterium]|jgi:hypothetical protein